MYCKEKKVFGIKPDYPYEGIIINQIFHSSDNEDYLKNLTTGSTPLYYDGKTNTFIHNVYDHYTTYYSYDFVLKSKNYVEKKAQIYFRKNNYPEIHCLNNLKERFLMLGKYNQDGISYIKAAGNKHAYFDLGDKGWNEALNKVGESNMWEINKKFLKQQLQQGKIFYLSHDPMKASGYFQKEVNFLKDNGFKFIKDGDFWKAVKQ